MNISLELERDLDWRLGELATLKVAATLAENSDAQRYTAILRALLALLYAHYEGFSKFAWDLYLQAVESSALPRSDLVDSLVRLSLAADYKALRGNLSDESLWTFVADRMPLALAEPATFPHRLVTESNLWPALYKANMNRAGLSDSEMVVREVHIRSLVSRRNEVAHGQSVGLKSLREYQSLEDAALAVMYDLAVAVIDSTEQCLYRRNP